MSVSPRGAPVLLVKKKDGFGAYKNCKGFLEGNLLRKIVGCCYSELGMRLGEVVWLSRRCGHCGLVEHARMSIGINYDDWKIIGASHLGIKVRCKSRLKSLVVLDDDHTNGRRPSITLISDDLYIVWEIVSIGVDKRWNFKYLNVG
ncbi:hypothetical protein A2U01_0016614 [Trifolium medium]|uniref:Uncharacterized protein n=1 Tax=Trifolium medium TaxID=97028 RepID=A0A392NAZ9_9FABA|nr:hypothetical protein [Trifolium medium]